jgi:hypothetical protein
MADEKRFAHIRTRGIIVRGEDAPCRGGTQKSVSSTPVKERKKIEAVIS